MKRVLRGLRGVSAVGCIDNGQVQVNGLRGIDSFDPYDGWLTDLRSQAQQMSIGSAGYQDMVARALGVDGSDARAATRLVGSQASDVSPSDVMTPDGAAKLGAAGKRGQFAAKFHTNRAQAIEQKMNALLSQIDSISDPDQQKQVRAAAADLASSLTVERVSAARATGIAGAIRAALGFRRQAANTSNPTDKRTLIGQAAASVAVAQQVATTDVNVTAPSMGSPAPGNTGIVPPQLPAGVPAGLPRNRPFVTVSDEGIDASMPGLNGLGAASVSQFKKSLRTYAKNVRRVMPVNAMAARTVAGLGGFRGLSGLGDATTNSNTGAPPITVGVDALLSAVFGQNSQLTQAGQQVVGAITGATQQVTPNGATPPVAPKSALPSWVFPAAGAAGLGLVVYLFLL